MVSLKNRLFFCVGILCCLSSWPGDAGAQADIFASKGQVVYAPVYSHIYIGDKERRFLLAVTLSIRNTDSDCPIVVEKATYYDSDGKLIREYIQSPVKLEKMSAMRFVVRESDKSGGSGASFIVEWRSEKEVSPPMVETIMIGAQTQQGISFTSRGRVLREK
ncbi:MAG: DUF3124 domain-containing protein [Deltaproteobacteria bacterium]|nr:DUF3124 domain-containing protein [Deltaproteobacteria bacterium]